MKPAAIFSSRSHSVISKMYWPALLTLAVLTLSPDAAMSQDDPCAKVTCSGHGTCLLKAGEPVCACNENYVPDLTTGLSCLPIQPAAAPAGATTGLTPLPAGKACTYDGHCRYPTVCYEGNCIRRVEKQTIKTGGMNLIMGGIFGLIVPGLAFFGAGIYLVTTGETVGGAISFGIGSALLIPGLALAIWGGVKRKKIMEQKRKSAQGSRLLITPFVTPIMGGASTGIVAYF